MSNKFLLISQVFYPDQVSTANLFTDMCSVLAADNVVVEVWAAHPFYTENNRQPSDLVYKGISIRFLPSTNFNKNSLPGRLINMVTFMTSVVCKVLFSGERTPVWTHTTPPFLGILLALVCSIKRRKFVYILLDIFPEGLIRLGKVSKKNPFVRIWHRLFMKALKRSYKVIVIGRDIKSWVENVCKDCSEKIEYIPHWQDDKMIFPGEFSSNSFVLEKRLKDKFVVQYSGNLGLWNEVKTMGKAVKRNIDNTVFIFVGGGLRKEELLSEFSVIDQQNVIIMPFQPNENFNTVLTASHVHLVTLRDGLEGMAVPCKIYGILASGIPVIAMVPEHSEIAYVVREENCGFVLSPTDLDGLIDALNLLKSDETLRKRMGQNGRKAFEKKYTTAKIAEKYKVLLNEL